MSRSRPSTRRRNNLLISAITAVVVVAAAVASGVAHATHAPKIRQQIYEPRRLSWAEHLADLEARKCFKRYYRMPLETFEKLVQLLRPLLEKNAHMAREYRYTLQVECVLLSLLFLPLPM